MRRLGRSIAVTLGLVLSGALVGGIAGGITVELSLSMAHDAWVAETGGYFGIGDAWIFGVVYGVPFGAILTPVISWLLLRDVSITLMLLWCASGAVAGGTIGWITTSGLEEQISGGLAGALVGPVVAAILLSRRAMRRLE